jgi:hypothetical protein
VVYSAGTRNLPAEILRTTANRNLAASTIARSFFEHDALSSPTSVIPIHT